MNLNEGEIILLCVVSICLAISVLSLTVGFVRASNMAICVESGNNFLLSLGCFTNTYYELTVPQENAIIVPN